MYLATTCSPVVIATRRSIAQALADRLCELADRFGALLRKPAGPPAQAIDLSGVRALDGLGDAMLRDIGLAAWQLEQRALHRSREVERWLW